MADTNLTIPQGLDPQAVNLARAIRQQESGGDYNKSGDSESSLGAYQWNNQPNGKSIPLKKGEIPSNFQSEAKEVGLDPTDFSPKNQDMVAYQKIKKLKDAGNNVVDIAAIWNGGDAKRQDANYVTPNGLPSQKKGVYDVPAYAKAVNDYYQKLKSDSNTNSSSDTSSTPQTFEEYMKQNPNGSQPGTTNPDLQAGNPTTPGNTSIGNAIANLVPGTKLAQGAGYGLAAAFGSQDGLIKANKEGIDIEGKLLEQIKNDKAKGKDTTRLETALKQLIPNIQNRANQVSDIGTGGIKNGEVLTSAAGLAALPAVSYLSGALSGGGIMNEAKGLSSGILGKTSSSVLTNPAIKGILEQSIGKGETIADLSRQDAINALGNALKEQSVTESGGKTEQLILKALKEINPTLTEKQGLIKIVAKGGFNLAKNLALTSILGNKVGGFIHSVTK